MYTYLLICVALASTSVAQIPSNNKNVDLTIDTLFRDQRIFNASSDSAAPIVNLNGNHNYQASQQVFFIHSPPSQWQKRFIPCVTSMTRDDYVVTPGKGFHKLHKRKVKWNQARKSCLEEGGQLAVLRSYAAEQYLLNWMAKEKVDRTWLGLHDQFEEGEWVTVEGKLLESIGYERWSTEPYPNQPDNYGGQQNCAALIKEGGMDDIECDVPHAYVCEMIIC